MMTNRTLEIGPLLVRPLEGTVVAPQGPDTLAQHAESLAGAEALALAARLRGVATSGGRADEVRTTADRLGRRLDAATDVDVLSDATSFLALVDAPASFSTEYTELTTEEKASRRWQLGMTLAAVMLRGDKEGEELVRFHLGLLGVE